LTVGFAKYKIRVLIFLEKMARECLAQVLVVLTFSVLDGKGWCVMGNYGVSSISRKFWVLCMNVLSQVLRLGRGVNFTHVSLMILNFLLGLLSL